MSKNHQTSDSLEAIRAAKAIAQRNIAAAITKEMSEFNRITGLCISAITLEVIAHYDRGSKAPDLSILSNVDLTVDLPL